MAIIPSNVNFIFVYLNANNSKEIYPISKIKTNKPFNLNFTIE